MAAAGDGLDAERCCRAAASSKGLLATYRAGTGGGAPRREAPKGRRKSLSIQGGNNLHITVGPCQRSARRDPPHDSEDRTNQGHQRSCHRERKRR